jgi:hypothetical protein
MFSRSFLPIVDISHRCPVAMQLIGTSLIFKLKTLWIQVKKKRSLETNKRPYPEGECTYEKIIKVTSIQGCANQSSNYVSPYI